MTKIQLGKIIEGILPVKKLSFNGRTLRSAGIGMLIYDKRWDRLFSSIEKPPAIVKAEESINSRLNELTRLKMESNMNKAEISVRKKRIDELSERYAGNDTYRPEIIECETKIRELSARELQIDKRSAELEREINENNISLLENSVSYLYVRMKKSRARIEELDGQINVMRETLKDRISEREALGESINETYNFLHSLLGAEQIEMLDKHFTLT